MGESIHTLQEFMVQSKGIIYMLSLGYLIGFVAFWKFISARDKDENSD